MSIDAPQLEPLLAVYPDAKVVIDGGRGFVALPSLHIAVDERVYVLDALLSPKDGPGYPTRLYLSQQIAERQTIGAMAANWTCETIGGRPWHTWSWRDVPQGLPLLEILLAHMRALR
ncbi:hypothetical protein [Paraburkholderia aromaticivorans]|uniref:hypothetical protein n=1 Tax=Paraburkholderia aromaticivorans TaxID=2026199 RepID=UPI001455E56A|nr:hypothetical protein [Paraburkholderia aromaticivorans]